MQKIKSIAAIIFIFSLISTLIPLYATTFAASAYTEIFGNLNGANYTARIPDPIENWNGKLIVYCHGYSHNEVNVTTLLSSASATVNPLIGYGYAVAASSYGGGGYNVQQGIKATYELTQYLISTYSITKKIFLWGVSMGGNIALLTSQKYPQVYSGVLDVCGSKDLADAYNTKMDFLSAKNDTDMAAKLQAINAPVPPYPFSLLALPLATQLDRWKTYCNTSAADIAAECGGTPQNAPQAYAKGSPTANADISRPVITVHGTADALVPISQTRKFQGAVIAAGRANLHRLYVIPGGQHADSSITSQSLSKLLELDAWSTSLEQSWTLVTDSRPLKAYPDLKETVWQKNATMPPNGQYDKIGLHRLVKTGIFPKGVVLLTNCPTWGMGESRISNPSTDSFTKYENFSQAIYWANRGFDVYGIDFRTHFAPKPLNASAASYAADWGLDVWVSDIKEAAEKAKAVSGFSKLFISGECSGGTAALNYATKYWQTDLKGIIMLDPNYQAVASHPFIGTMNATNTYNLTKTLETMRSSNTWAMEDFPQSFKDLSWYALQNPGAPAVNPVTNESLSPVLNPLTNRTWANITEWYTAAAYNNFGAYPTMPGLYANALNGYTDISSLELAISKSEWLPQRILLENQAMSDWTNCTYLSYDYDDHYKEIGAPVLIFTAQLFKNRTGTFRYVNGINSTLTGVMLNNYGHTDVFFGTYSARDVSQPALAWMLNELGLTPRATAFSSATVMTGWTWNFFVHSTAGAGQYSYQWYEGTTLMAGQTKMVLPVTKNASGTYTYYCKVTDANGATVNSNSVTLTVFS